MFSKYQHEVSEVFYCNYEDVLLTLVFPLLIFVVKVETLATLAEGFVPVARGSKVLTGKRGLVGVCSSFKFAGAGQVRCS